MTEVVLASCSGGIVNLTLIEDLRGDTVTGDAKELADLALFEDEASVRPTRAQYDADFEAAFATGRSLWSAHAEEIEQGMDAGRLRERLLGPFLSLLGFNLQFQRSHLSAGDGSFRITHLGWEGEDAPPMILDPSPPDARGERQRRSAHEEMQAYLNASTQHTWGIVSDGRVVRLVRDFHHTRTKGYVEFEIEHIFEASSVADFRAFLRVCHSSRFKARPELHGEADGVGRSPHDSSLLELLYHRSVSAGVAAGRRLQPQVRRAIEHLANGALATNPELRRRVLEEAGFGRELYRELLTVLYRVLFLLFAEQREMLRGNRLYEETYSLARLRKTAETNRTEGRRFDLWEGLKVTFSAFHDDQRAAALGVYPYNGELFDPSRTPNLGGAHIPNSEVAIAIRSLTTVEVNKMTLYVDYRNLGVEELGTVYESLLDYRLRVNDTGSSLLVKDPTSERTVVSGQAYLAPMSTERGDLASYYTPPALVSLVLDRSLDLLLEDRLKAAGSDPAARAAAILDFRVIDPACGSGAFLAEALERLSIALATEHAAPSEPADAEIATARREILSRCIYGADKDPFAVELCKVALWIHCAVPDAPLSFLDHHIVCGDSLVGWPMFEVPDSVPNGAYEYAKANKEDKKILASARNENKEFLAGVQTLWSASVSSFDELSLPSLLERPDRTHDDVREKARAYAEYISSSAYQESKAAADLWVSAFFWNHLHGPAPTTQQYHSFLAGNIDTALASESGILCEAVNPLHWALAFPDVRDRGGFDLVVGNPPWEQFKGQELEFFAETSPLIAAMASKPRKLAIEELANSEPDLFARWINYRAAQDRLAHYAKESARFTRTGAEPNTYVMFTELAAELTRNRGWSGLVVKSGIAIDISPSALWRQLVESNRVREVRDIVNGTETGMDRVFTAVAPVERFSVFVLGQSVGHKQDIQASTLNFGLDEAIRKPLVPFSLERLRLLAPRTWTLPSFRAPVELEVAEAIYRRFGTLDFDRATLDDAPENPWDVRYVRLFDSSGSQDLFVRPEELTNSGFHLCTNREMMHPDGRKAVPLYEGQMVGRWDHRAKTFEGYAGTGKYGPKPGIPTATMEQHADPEFEVEPRYWMLWDTAKVRLDERARDRALVAFRDIARQWNDRRCLRAAVIPSGPATHTLPVFATPKSQAMGFAALLNSMTADFLAKLHLSGVHLSSWVVSQVAAPTPDQLDPECWSLAQRLSVTSTKLAESSGFELHRWEQEERLLLDAECDARVALSYQLHRDEYEVVLDSFGALARREIHDDGLGEFRTKRLCLEAYDRLERGT